MLAIRRETYKDDVNNPGVEEVIGLLEEQINICVFEMDE